MFDVPKDIVTNYIYTHFKKPKRAKAGREINAECAICGDSKKRPGKKKRFNYNIFTNEWQCFNCGAAGRSFLSLVSAVERIPYSQAAKRFKKYFIDNMEEYFKEKRYHPEEEPENEFDIDKFLKEDCFYIEDKQNSLFLESIRQRSLKIVSEKAVSLKDYRFYCCYKGSRRGRLVIPMYYRGKCVYFQARKLAKKQEPKYLNSPTPKTHFILFEDDIHPEMPVYLFEGFWEVLILNRYLNLNSTSILGRFIHTGFIEKILEKTEKNLIFCFDNDEEGFLSLVRALKVLKPYRNRTEFLVWPDTIEEKDLGDLWIKWKDPKKISDFLSKNTLDFYGTSVKTI